MNWRRTELSQITGSLAWLAKEDAARAFESASAKTSRQRYGLDDRFWAISATWNVDDVSEEEGSAKLESLLSEEFLLVFSREDVCRISRAAFLAHWRDMFLPARDDVVIIPLTEEWCLFYSHEDEFEFGRKKEPNQSLATVFRKQE